MSDTPEITYLTDETVGKLRTEDPARYKEAMSDDAAYEREVAAQNARARGEEPVLEPAAEPVVPASAPVTVVQPDAAAAPVVPVAPSAGATEPDLTATAKGLTLEEQQFLSRYNLPVVNGKIKGTYDTFEDYLKANEHLRSFASKRSVDGLREDPTVLRTLLNENPDLAGDLRNILGLAPAATAPAAGVQPSPSLEVPGHLAPTGAPFAATAAPGQPSAASPDNSLTPEQHIEQWANNLVPIGTLLQNEFAPILAQEGIEQFPQTDEQWNEFKGANPILAKLIEDKANSYQAQRDQVVAFGSHVRALSDDAARRRGEENNTVINADRTRLIEEFSGNDQEAIARLDTILVDRLAELTFQHGNDPRFFEPVMIDINVNGQVQKFPTPHLKLRAGALRDYILSVNADAVMQERINRERQTLAAEHQTFVQTKLAGAPAPVRSGAASTAGTGGANGGPTLPPPEVYKRTDLMRGFTREQRDKIDQMIDSLPPEQRSAYY